MIRLENLVKRYQTETVETTALNSISIDINEGDFVSIMGPSGCGKSTLLNILGMIDHPTGGDYFFLDHNISSCKERERTDIRRDNIGFIFQSFNLIDELSVYENVELPLIYANCPTSQRKDKVMRVLEAVNMAHRKDHFPLQLSGGQQQRVAVARALVNDPKIILADEPTGNLDSSNGKEVMNLLSDLNQQGATIVMVTHSESDATFSQRVIRLLDGNVLN